MCIVGVSLSPCGKGWVHATAGLFKCSVSNGMSARSNTPDSILLLCWPSKGWRIWAYAGAHGLRVIMPGLGCPLVHVLVFLLFWICSMLCLPWGLYFNYFYLSNKVKWKVLCLLKQIVAGQRSFAKLTLF
jgi:hypothetical protein